MVSGVSRNAKAQSATVGSFTYVQIHGPVRSPPSSLEFCSSRKVK